MAHIRRKRKNRNHAGGEFDGIARLWALRALVDMHGYKRLLGAGLWEGNQIGEDLGLDIPVDEYTENNGKDALRDFFAGQYDALLDSCQPLQSSPELVANLSRLQTMLNLADADCRILELMIHIHLSPPLCRCLDHVFGELSTRKLHGVLAELLDLDELAVRHSLSRVGRLVSTGLISVDGGQRALSNKLDMISNQFCDLMDSVLPDMSRLLDGKIVVGRLPTLAMHQFTHVEQPVRYLKAHLSGVLDQQQAGVNIFCHGAPGTGKTELVRLLSQKLACQLFEVSYEDEDGDPIGGAGRLRAMRAAYNFFGSSRAILLFDESEDVFNDGTFSSNGKSTADLHKAWMTRMMEECPIPTLWLSNSSRDMDPAFIRRFDYVFEMPLMSFELRAQHLREQCGDILDDGNITRFAKHEKMSAAVVARAAKVVRNMQEELDQDERKVALEHIINNTLQLQSLNKLPEPVTDEDKLYDPRFVNCEQDLLALAEGLKGNRNARLCLFGPPGTGKTAYGRWLAKELDMPLMVRQASSLLSMWVGESEKNIARAFAEAKNQKAILLIDEVDSFLQDRSRAQRSWEVTQVNELLTQMEKFDGIFIASTNLVEGLDKASLRRFDLKLLFDYLRPEQAWELLQRHCEQLALPVDDSSGLPMRLKNAGKLAPGDYAAVSRQNRFAPISSAKAFVDALAAEVQMRNGVEKPRIGFV